MYFGFYEMENFEYNIKLIIINISNFEFFFFIIIAPTEAIIKNSVLL